MKLGTFVVSSWLPTRASLLLILLVLFASCFPGAPAVSPQRTLDLDGEGGSAKSPKEFGVVFAGPKGEVEAPSEITVVFNRPMRPLELADGDAAAMAPGSAASMASVEVEGKAALKGAWRWMGTSALLFAPEEPLPRATSFKVTVPAGTRALDGPSPRRIRSHSPHRGLSW